MNPKIKKWLEEQSKVSANHLLSLLELEGYSKEAIKELPSKGLLTEENVPCLPSVTGVLTHRKIFVGDELKLESIFKTTQTELDKLLKGDVARIFHEIRCGDEVIVDYI